MALVAVPPFGLWAAEVLSTVTYSTNIIDAVGEKSGHIFQAPKTGTIDRVCFRTSTVTTGDTVDVRLETVGSDGMPSGTLVGTNTNASKAILTTDDNVWFEVTLTAGASVTKGQHIAIVVVMGAGGGNVQISRVVPTLGSNGGRAYTALYTGASWAIQQSSAPIGAVRYSDGTYPYTPNLYPHSAQTSASYNNGVSGDEHYNRIVLPFTCKIGGIWHHSSSANPGDYTMSLYTVSGTTGTLLEAKSIDGDAIGSGSTANVEDIFTTEYTIPAGTHIAVGKRATTATNVNLAMYTMPSAAVIEASSMGTITTRGIRANSAGAFSEDSAQYAMGPIITALEDGAGGGGSGVRAYAYAS